MEYRWQKSDIINSNFILSKTKYFYTEKNKQTDSISQQESDQKAVYLGIVWNNVLKVLSTDFLRILTPFQISTRSLSAS